MNYSTISQKFAKCLVAGSLLAVAGCGVTVPAAGPAQSRVMGGQQGIAGASIQLYAVGTGGDGSAASALLNTPVSTDGNGYFSIYGKFTCPAPETLTYITATGGNPGLPAGSANPRNPNLLLIAAIGRCDTAAVLNPIAINEVTTVAAVSALFPFIASANHVGSSSAHAGSLQFSFSNAAELARLDQGTSPGAYIAPNDLVPFVVINSLANTTAACVNSTGGTFGDSSPCGLFFSLTGAANGTRPANTLDALLALASKPSVNTVPLYSLAPAGAAFQPQLNLPPIDFSIGVYHPVAVQVLPIAGITYPNQSVGSTSGPQPITIYNSGSSPATVTSVTVAGANASDFAVTGSCAQILNSGDSCTLRILFSPTAAGRRTAYLAVTATGTPSNPAALPLAGLAN